MWPDGAAGGIRCTSLATCLPPCGTEVTPTYVPGLMSERESFLATAICASGVRFSFKSLPSRDFTDRTSPSSEEIVPRTRMAVVFANVLVVQPTLPVKSLADYVKVAREKKGLTYASSGIGGAGHLAGELLSRVAKVPLVHVPYKGGGPAMQGFLGGQVDSFFATPISSISQIRSGKARAIATTGLKRPALMPDVPTVAESGYPGYEALNWYGYLGPVNLPKEVVERLNRDIGRALANPEAVAQLAKTGVEPHPMSPAEFGKYIEREYQTWGKLVKEAGIKAE